MEKLIHKDFIKTSQLFIDQTDVDKWKQKIIAGEKILVYLQQKGAEYYIIDGNHRYHAYVQLGYREIPCEILSSKELTKYIFRRRL